VGREGHSARRLATAAPIFTALGDRTRLHLVSRLCQEGALSISDLTEGTALTRQAVTKHLRVLADAGLATSARRGREHHWRIEATRLAEARQLLAQVSAQWDRALARLVVTVEADDVAGRRRSD
jgi:DNA-binding transcriptional ArsR family regulator